MAFFTSWKVSKVLRLHSHKLFFSPRANRFWPIHSEVETQLLFVKKWWNDLLNCSWGRHSDKERWKKNGQSRRTMELCSKGPSYNFPWRFWYDKTLLSITSDRKLIVVFFSPVTFEHSHWLVALVMFASVEGQLKATKWPFWGPSKSAAIWLKTSMSSLLFFSLLFCVVKKFVPGEKLQLHGKPWKSLYQARGRERD